MELSENFSENTGAWLGSGKGEIHQVNDNERENAKTGVNHRTGTKGSSAIVATHLVIHRTSCPILQIQGNTSVHMNDKDDQQPYFCDKQNSFWHIMQRFRIFNKSAAGDITNQRRQNQIQVTEQVNSQKQNHKDSSHCHKLFLENRTFGNFPQITHIFPP